jgi:hypothetical protein
VSQRPDLIERASLATATAGDTAALRHRLRHAPASVRLAIDRNRRAQGLDPLWQRAAGKPHTRPPLIRPRSVRAGKTFSYRLFGVVAPHISRPVTLRDGTVCVPETFSDECWPRVIRRLERQSPVSLRLGHSGHEIASTAGGTLRFHADPKLGLLATADLQELSLGTLPTRSGSGFVALSVAFVATRTSNATLLGKRVRVVEDCYLHHVAVLAPHDRPAYPGAVGRVVATNKPAALRDAWSDVKQEAYLRLSQR